MDKKEHSVLAGQLSIAVPQVYAETATGQVRSGQLDAAEQSLTTGFRLDPSEPLLWLAKARLQQARDMPRLALASVNYALAIWQDADTHYIFYQKALALAEEIAAVAFGSCDCDRVVVRVRKPHPPVGGPCDDAGIEIVRHTVNRR